MSSSSCWMLEAFGGRLTSGGSGGLKKLSPSIPMSSPPADPCVPFYRARNHASGYRLPAGPRPAPFPPLSPSPLLNILSITTAILSSLMRVVAEYFMRYPSTAPCPHPCPPFSRSSDTLSSLGHAVLRAMDRERPTRALDSEILKTGAMAFSTVVSSGQHRCLIR